MSSAGKVLMIPKGDYVPATTYKNLDVVYYEGRSYVCKQESTGNVPTNTTYWQPMTPDFSTQYQALTNQLTSDTPTTVDFVSVINLTDALGVNAKDVKVKIEAVQSGSGTPSPTNIRPITGFSNAVLTVNGETVTISLGNTVYGGLLDVASGVLTVNRAYASYDGSEDESWAARWTNYDVVGCFTLSSAVSNPKLISNNVGCRGISNQCEWLPFDEGYEGLPSLWSVRYNDNYPSEFSITQSNEVVIKVPNVTTVSDLKTYLASNPLTIVYEITPTTVQLTPTQIQLLQGNNTISADCGDVSIQYFKELNIGGAVAELQTAVNAILAQLS